MSFLNAIDPIEIATFDFVRFVAASLVLYYLVPRRWQNTILLLISYFFLWTWSAQFVLWVAAITVANFFYGQWLAPRARKNKPALWLAVAVNVGVLVLLKYNGVYESGLQRFIGFWGLGDNFYFNILFPLGFSYYTLSNIAYLIDIFTKQQKPTTNLLDYAVFIAYFPRLTAGPIEVARDFLPQLETKRLVDNAALARGVALITIGATRKIILGDTMRQMIPPELFTQPQALSAGDLVIYTLAYGAVLYNDFAGYTQIVRGVSLLFGIELSRNFVEPLYSRNFTELWDRWHRTLSLWMRQYIFFPATRQLLRRTRNPKDWRTILGPPILTMVASGLWHDISLSFLVWGIAHGLFQVYERVMQMRHKQPPADKQPLRRQWFTRMRTLGLGLAVQPFFYLPLGLAFNTYAGLVRNWDMPVTVDLRVWTICLLTIGLESWQIRANDELFFRRWPWPAQAIGLAIIWLAVFLFTRADVGEAFIYQGF